MKLARQRGPMMTASAPCVSHMKPGVVPQARWLAQWWAMPWHQSNHGQYLEIWAVWIMTYLRSFSTDVRCSWASCYPNLIGFPSARCSGLCSACPCASCCASCASSSSCSAGPHPDLEFDEWLASACSLPSNNSRHSRYNYVSKQQNYTIVFVIQITNF